MKLWNKMNSRDQEIFNFNMKNLDWDEYFFVHVRGLRMYLLNDPLDTVDEARSKFNKYVSFQSLLRPSLVLLQLKNIMFFYIVGYV